MLNLIKEETKDMKKTKEECTGCDEWCEPNWKQFIRPVGFVVTLGIFFLLMFIDGNVGNFTVREAYLPILETVLVTIVVAFFGSRGVEKTTREIIAGKKRTNPGADDSEIPNIYKQNQTQE